MAAHGPIKGRGRGGWPVSAVGGLLRAHAAEDLRLRRRRRQRERHLREPHRGHVQGARRAERGARRRPATASPSTAEALRLWFDL